MGDHTDYNDGFVLPVALEQHLQFSCRRHEGEVILTSDAEAGTVRVSLSNGSGPTTGWGRYVTAVVRQLVGMGIPVAGCEGTISSTLPIGSGLSSSAALEIGVALAIAARRIEREALADACHQAENVHVGLPCGVMDQMTVALAERGHALFIDCRSKHYEHVPFPLDLAVAVLDPETARELQASGYRERWEQCRAAAKVLGVPALRDVTLDDVKGRRAELGDVLYRRARHVVTENERVLATRSALASGDLDALRPLFDESHASLARDFEVTIPEIDALQRCAAATDGVMGARLTGGGFGGCLVALVRAADADSVAQEAVVRYRTDSGRTARAWVSPPAEGARRL